MSRVKEPCKQMTSKLPQHVLRTPPQVDISVDTSMRRVTHSRHAPAKLPALLTARLFAPCRALLLAAPVSPQRWASSDRAAAATARWAAAPLLQQLAATGSIDVVAEHYSRHKYAYDGK